MPAPPGTAATPWKLKNECDADSRGRSPVRHSAPECQYEAGSAQPTLDALIRLAKVLHVSLDGLVFDDHERGPSDDLALQFEAVSGMPEEERRIIKALLDGMILKYQAKQITERG